MKFARYLDENTVPEWRKVYIQYRGLKKLIKRVAEHREARIRYETELGLARTHSSSTAVAPSTPSADPFVRRRTHATPTTIDQEAQSSLASSSGYLRRNDYGGTSAPAPALPPLPVVTLAGTGLRLSLDSYNLDNGASHKPDATADIEAQIAQQHSATKPQFLQDLAANTDADQLTSASRKQASSATQDSAASPTTPRLPGTGTVRYDDDANPSSRPAPIPLHHHSRRANSSAASSKHRLLPRTASSGRISTRSIKDDPPQSLQELISTYFDDEEAKIFSACNAELDRIVTFYEAQEQEAAKKYTQLARQLKELADHRREYRAKYNISDHDRTSAGSRRHRMSQLLSNLPGSKLIVADEVAHRIKSIPALSQLKSRDPEQTAEPAPRFSLDQPAANKQRGDSGSDDDAGDRRRAQALAQMQASLRGWDDDTDTAIRKANKAAAMSHDPEAYAAARKKLKAAVLEYYKFLDTLTNYKILNRTGFAKVMKKLSKTTGVPCADLYYQDKVAPTILVTSDRVEKLRKATEDIYTAYFEHGNRKQALNRLRAREDHTTHHYSVFRSGFYLGISLCGIVAGLREAMQPDTQAAIPQWQGLLRVYGAEFIPTLFALLFGLNLAWWHAVRINTVFIFEWDVRTTMDHRQFFEIPSLLMLLLSCCFWVSFVNPFPDSIAPTTWPTVWLVIALILVLNPLPILMPASRAWFVKSLLRVFTAGWKRVEFRDFFLGDELNSIAWTISNFWYFGCEWHHDWAHPDRCSPNSTFWTAALLSVPAWLRLGQCIRRWVDSDYKTHLHLVNAGKYSSAVINNFMYIHYRRNGSHTGADKALWILFAVIYSLWHIGWDLLMDWSVLKPRAKYFLLRNEIWFPQPVYYIFMVVDVIGRSVWVIYLIPGSASVTLRSFLAALVEMIRRACWNNLRVENEQIGNTDSFKIMRDLPLPYRQKLMEDDGGGVEGESHHKTGIFASVKLASLRNKKGIATSASHLSHEGERQEAEEGITQEERARREGVGKERRRSLIESLRNKLVPDAKGDEYGKQLDERAVTKGQSGRDYMPRRAETVHGFVDVDSEDDDEDEDEEEARVSESNDDGGSKRVSPRNGHADLPTLPPRAMPRGSGASVQVELSQSSGGEGEGGDHA
ncbi:related to putative phosphate transporter 1 [Ustilago trichophora]|uniref:Related to putative phosphate transporter 1 n=1 Tax=Ustilago trichophora TaxID=86804 RepID=A0A5C3EFJ9_9BASI|nr:related to putative phosphate transporter 1 [Ustilago trichophora]